MIFFLQTNYALNVVLIQLNIPESNLIWDKIKVGLGEPIKCNAVAENWMINQVFLMSHFGRNN